MLLIGILPDTKPGSNLGQIWVKSGKLGSASSVIVVAEVLPGTKSGTTLSQIWIKSGSNLGQIWLLITYNKVFFKQYFKSDCNRSSNVIRIIRKSYMFDKRVEVFRAMENVKD